MSKENENRERINDIVFSGLGVAFQQPKERKESKLYNLLSWMAGARGGQGSSASINQGVQNPQPTQPTQPTQAIPEPELTPAQKKLRQQYPATFGM